MFQMMLEAADDKATLYAIKNTLQSDMIHEYNKLDVIRAILGLQPVSKKSGEPPV